MSAPLSFVLVIDFVQIGLAVVVVALVVEWLWGVVVHHLLHVAEVLLLHLVVHAHHIHWHLHVGVHILHLLLVHHLYLRVF